MEVRGYGSYLDARRELKSRFLHDPRENNTANHTDRDSNNSQVILQQQIENKLPKHGDRQRWNGKPFSDCPQLVHELLEEQVSSFGPWKSSNRFRNNAAAAAAAGDYCVLVVAIVALVTTDCG